MRKYLSQTNVWLNDENILVVVYLAYPVVISIPSGCSKPRLKGVDCRRRRRRCRRVLLSTRGPAAMVSRGGGGFHRDLPPASRASFSLLLPVVVVVTRLVPENQSFIRIRVPGSHQFILGKKNARCAQFSRKNFKLSYVK